MPKLPTRISSSRADPRKLRKHLTPIDFIAFIAFQTRLKLRLIIVAFPKQILHNIFCPGEPESGQGILSFKYVKTKDLIMM